MKIHRTRWIIPCRIRDIDGKHMDLRFQSYCRKWKGEQDGQGTFSTQSIGMKLHSSLDTMMVDWIEIFDFVRKQAFRVHLGSRDFTTIHF